MLLAGSARRALRRRDVEGLTELQRRVLLAVIAIVDRGGVPRGHRVADRAGYTRSSGAVARVMQRLSAIGCIAWRRGDYSTLRVTERGRELAALPARSPSSGRGESVKLSADDVARLRALSPDGQRTLGQIAREVLRRGYEGAPPAALVASSTLDAFDELEAALDTAIDIVRKARNG